MKDDWIGLGLIILGAISLTAMGLTMLYLISKNNCPNVEKTKKQQQKIKLLK